MQNKLSHYIFAALFIAGISSYSLSQESPIDFNTSFTWRCIGPANQGGRIVDIEAIDGDFKRVWLATGSGGVWKSENAGTTWESVFDHYSTASIGDVAVSQNNPEIIWVGTGESNNRNSVSWGDGVFKSTDGGKTFVNMGLNSTHHISRIVLHPSNDQIAFVAAMGHLWGYSGDRGLFRTINGGDSWSKLVAGLPDDGYTGCTDLVIDPGNPQVLYAAFYHRLRQPWHFQSGGQNGGLYKSTDGGQSWSKLTNGLPTGETGRIGIDIYRKDPRILVALVEAERTDNLSNPGSGIYRTEDGGESWTYINTYNNRPFYYSQIRINPHDDQRIYALTTRFMVSEDGGKTLENGSEDQEVHGDFHAMWLDPNDPDRYYLGADKGASLTHDHGKHFLLFDNFAIGQFYRINFDMRDPFYVYGGLQDNGSYAVASFSRDIRGILNDSNWKLHWGDGQFINIDPADWRKVFSSSENGNYLEYDPLTHRIESISPNWRNIQNYEQIIPDSLQYTDEDIRYNWTAPLVMSPHNSSVLYAGGNHVMMSEDEGEHWRIISPDLTRADWNKWKSGRSGGITPDNTGAEQHCAIYTLSPSPLDPQVIWVGTDDGLVHFTRNGGREWINVREAIPAVPEGLWVSRVEASHFDPARAYVTFDGHRSDNFQPWIFMTDDFGETWSDLKSNLPENEVIRVVREDPQNPDLLFIGTETGVRASLDRGNTWFDFMDGMPTVSVYDLKIHPRDHSLIAGTHGRSIWVIDDISPLQQFERINNSQECYLFHQKKTTIWENTSRGGQRGHFWFGGENPETIEPTSSIPRARFANHAMVSYFNAKNLDDPPKLTISDVRGNTIHQVLLKTGFGFHRYKWDLQYDAKWLTDAQVERVDNIFRELMETYNYNSIERAYSRFKRADNPRSQRLSIQILDSEWLNQPLGDEYLLKTAGPGIYILTLECPSGTMKRTLEIREDPLLNE